MNRRSFMKLFAALPVVGGLVAPASKPTPRYHVPNGDLITLDATPYVAGRLGRDADTLSVAIGDVVYMDSSGKWQPWRMGDSEPRVLGVVSDDGVYASGALTYRLRAGNLD